MEICRCKPQMTPNCSLQSVAPSSRAQAQRPGEPTYSRTCHFVGQSLKQSKALSEPLHEPPVMPAGLQEGQEGQAVWQLEAKCNRDAAGVCPGNGKLRGRHGKR